MVYWTFIYLKLTLKKMFEQNNYRKNIKNDLTDVRLGYYPSVRSRVNINHGPDWPRYDIFTARRAKSTGGGGGVNITLYRKSSNETVININVIKRDAPVYKQTVRNFLCTNE